MKTRRSAPPDLRPACPSCPAGRMNWKRISESQPIQWEEDLQAGRRIEHSCNLAEADDFFGNVSLATLIEKARVLGDPLEYLECEACGRREPLTANRCASPSSLSKRLRH